MSCNSRYLNDQHAAESKLTAKIMNECGASHSDQFRSVLKVVSSSIRMTELSTTQVKLLASMMVYAADCADAARQTNDKR